MREIIYPKEKIGESTDKKCPKCGGELRWTIIRCPDGYEGCCVIHYGYICMNCGATFQS